MGIQGEDGPPGPCCLPALILADSHGIAPRSAEDEATRGHMRNWLFSKSPLGPPMASVPGIFFEPRGPRSRLPLPRCRWAPPEGGHPRLRPPPRITHSGFPLRNRSAGAISLVFSGEGHLRALCGAGSLAVGKRSGCVFRLQGRTILGVRDAVSDCQVDTSVLFPGPATLEQPLRAGCSGSDAPPSPSAKPTPT